MPNNKISEGFRRRQEARAQLPAWLAPLMPMLFLALTFGSCLLIESSHVSAVNRPGRARACASA